MLSPDPVISLSTAKRTGNWTDRYEIKPCEKKKMPEFQLIQVPTSAYNPKFQEKS